MDHSAYIDAAAATLGLKLAAEQRKGVLLFFAWPRRMAELVQGLPLRPADESGNVFVPVAPQARASMNAARRRRHRRAACATAAPRPRGGVQQALAAHRGHRRARSTPSPRARRACAEARRSAVDAHPRRERMTLAGVPFAVKNLFDIAGAAHAGRLEDRTRRRAGRARRGAGAPARSRRRGAGRRAQHGRVRLRLHHREHALRRRRATRTT